MGEVGFLTREGCVLYRLCRVNMCLQVEFHSLVLLLRAHGMLVSFGRRDTMEKVTLGGSKCYLG